jgi:hypothetical protein
MTDPTDLDEYERYFAPRTDGLSEDDRRLYESYFPDEKTTAQTNTEENR